MWKSKNVCCFGERCFVQENITFLSTLFVSLVPFVLSFFPRRPTHPNYLTLLAQEMPKRLPGNFHPKKEKDPSPFPGKKIPKGSKYKSITSWCFSKYISAPEKIHLRKGASYCENSRNPFRKMPFSPWRNATYFSSTFSQLRKLLRVFMKPCHCKKESRPGLFPFVGAECGHMGGENRVEYGTHENSSFIVFSPSLFSQQTKKRIFLPIFVAVQWTSAKYFDNYVSWANDALFCFQSREAR